MSSMNNLSFRYSKTIKNNMTTSKILKTFLQKKKNNWIGNCNLDATIFPQEKKYKITSLFGEFESLIGFWIGKKKREIGGILDMDVYNHWLLLY